MEFMPALLSGAVRDLLGDLVTHRTESLRTVRQGLPLVDVDDHIRQRQVIMGYPHKCGACQHSHGRSLAVGSASDQQLPIGIPLRLLSSTVKELEFGLVEIASLAQQEQMCFGMCDALQQRANTFTRIVVIDDPGERRMVLSASDYEQSFPN